MKRKSSITRVAVALGAITVLLGIPDFLNARPAPLADANLQARYRMDEGSGTSAGDLTGNGNTGTLTGGPTWDTSDPSGNPYAVAFDGTDDYIETSKSLYRCRRAPGPLRQTRSRTPIEKCSGYGDWNSLNPNALAALSR